MSVKWTPRWVYHRGTPGLAARLIPYCTMDGGPANKVHPPDEGQILAPTSDVLTDDDRAHLRSIAIFLEGQFRRESVGRDIEFLHNLAAASENPESTEEGR